MAKPRTNMQGISTLLVDGDHYLRSIVAQILRAFGAETPTMADNGGEAMRWLTHNCFDMCIMEAVLPDMHCTDLIRWIRRRDSQAVKFTPVIVLTGYTQPKMIAAARDAGANGMVKKPVAPRVLWEHIVGIGRSARPFIEAGDYAGPDRRFKDEGPIDGFGRRSGDAEKTQAAAAAAAASPTAENEVVSQ